MKAKQDDKQEAGAAGGSLLGSLMRQVEGLSLNPPAYSRTAYTPRRTTHVQFINGGRVEEGGAPVVVTVECLDELVEMHLIAITAYRQTIEGPVDLVWRVEPEFRIAPGVDPRLYSRLCFEPSLVNVSPGIWLEERLASRAGAP